jgi:hypothetical protein
VVAAGLLDIDSIEVDSSGQIFLLSLRSPGEVMYVFDRSGNFVRSFGKKGPGPRELMTPLYPKITGSDRVVVTDVLKKILVFDSDGSLLDETAIDPNFVIASPLDNGNHVIFWKGGADSPTGETYNEKVSLFAPSFVEIVTLDVLGISREAPVLDPVLIWRVLGDRIYIGNEQRGYEILVYDSGGLPVRKIRKEYSPVPFYPELKERILQNIPLDSPRRAAIRFPRDMPPYQTFFPDEQGRLFVVTFERGTTPGSYLCDILNPAGAFVGRFELELFLNWSGFPVYALSRNGRLYSVREKASGYKELVVSRMEWQ